MKTTNQILFLSFLAIISCSKEINSPTQSNDKNIQRIQKKFKIGDINNDRINDIATVDYNYDFNNDQVHCKNNFCSIIVRFSNKIPSLEITNTRSVYVEKTNDVTKDGANEILVFSLTNEGFWNIISVYSFQNNGWKELANTKAFLSEPRQFKNRVIQSDGDFFLIGDDWTDDLQERSLKLKLP